MDKFEEEVERLVAKYDNEQQRRKNKQNTSTSSKSTTSSQNMRGLESWTAIGADKTTRAVEQCISAVMDEQDRQWEEDDDDADAIAQQSLYVTKDSARRARRNGLQDEKEAVRIRSEDLVLAEKQTKKLKKKKSKTESSRKISSVSVRKEKPSIAVMDYPVSPVSAIDEIHECIQSVSSGSSLTIPDKTVGKLHALLGGADRPFADFLVHEL